MRLTTTKRDLAALRADLAVSFAWEDDGAPLGVDDRKLRDALARRMKAEKFRGRRSDLLRWNADGAYPADRFLVVGLGKPNGEQAAALRDGAARAARAAATVHARSIALRLPPSDAPAAAEAAVRAAVEGTFLGAYHFGRYLTDPDARPEALRALTVSSGLAPARARRAADLGAVTGRAVDLARDLVNEPPSTMDPLELTRRARAAGRAAGLTVRVLGRRELDKLGMGAMLAVARGSSVEPRLVHMTYRPKATRARGRKAPKVVLVGKGVTFDSGGLNLKPGASMLDMKCDMAGAGAVVATMSALADAGCAAEVHGLVGLVENMTGGAAYKPGDILKTYHGKTVEIGNTDAEGRLVLADVLAYAIRTVEPDAVVDVATLTGACVVALGQGATGLFSRDDALSGALLAAAERAGERVWRLPMYDAYLESLQGGPADLRNVGGRWGGAITAALFLGEFVPRDLAWAHLDIAGPAFRDKASAELRTGGTGAGVATMLRWLEGLGGKDGR